MTVLIGGKEFTVPQFKCEFFYLFLCPLIFFLLLTNIISLIGRGYKKTKMYSTGVNHCSQCIGESLILQISFSTEFYDTEFDFRTIKIYLKIYLLC